MTLHLKTAKRTDERECGRRRKQAVEMTDYGKHGKTMKLFFSTLPTVLGDRCGDYHISIATAATGINSTEQRSAPERKRKKLQRSGIMVVADRKG
ncbi:MAG: hypothetical protein WCA10_22410 [Terracidiphilus sp.]